ncbi:MAG: aminoacyl-tRNA hydrolase [Candidatus Omnitrophota bacterium]|nr:aminoacyl-tRNA hydrolase [Candidatus Omnitrophota bacterium]
MKIIFGLGNPGAGYAHNRHNVGFMVLDRIAHDAGARFRRALRFKGHAVRCAAGRTSVILVKPATFMNNSGICVRRAIKAYNVTLDDILIVYDDMSLPLGTMRLRIKGRSGGHNGMASVIAETGEERISRLRIGIDVPAGCDATEHVLSDFSSQENTIVKACIDKAVLACRDWAACGSMYAMNKYNT